MIMIGIDKMPAEVESRAERESAGQAEGMSRRWSSRAETTGNIKRHLKLQSLQVPFAMIL